MSDNLDPLEILIELPIQVPFREKGLEEECVLKKFETTFDPYLNFIKIDYKFDRRGDVSYFFKLLLLDNRVILFVT